MAGARGGHVARGGKGALSWIVQLGAGCCPGKPATAVGAGLAFAAGDQDRAVRKQRRGVVVTRCGHASRKNEDARDRVIQLCACEPSGVLLFTACNQYLSVQQEGC